MHIIPWLEHHLERAQQGVKYNALLNCHAADLHSIVLHDEPGNCVRMFVAGHDHTLHRNRGDCYSIAIHPHHCDVRLVGLFGPAFNDVYALTPNPAGTFREMEYHSAITHRGSAGSLSRTGRRADAHRIAQQPLESAPKLLAHQLHSIYVPEGRSAAWLVIEGAEWAQYEPLCWTNDLCPLLGDGFYKPMGYEEVARMLAYVIHNIPTRPIT